MERMLTVGNDRRRETEANPDEDLEMQKRGVQSVGEGRIRRERAKLPICKGPMHRSMRHLPAVQNKIKRQPRKPKSEFDI